MEQKNFEREVLDRLIRLETKLDQQDYVAISEKTDKALNISTQNQKEIEELKSTNKWLVRTIIGLVIGAIFYAVFQIK